MIRAPCLIHLELAVANPPPPPEPPSPGTARGRPNPSHGPGAAPRVVPLGSIIGLLMDPAVAAAAAPAEANGESGGCDDAAEFVDAVESGEDAAAAGGMAAGGEEGVRELPEELAKGVVCLECETSPGAAAAGMGPTCRVYLIGTAHVSQESCDQVKAVINYLKPQAVFLELCLSRVSILTPQNLQVPTMNEMIDMWKNKKMNTFGILYSWFLAKVASQLEVLPGAEFRVAFEEAISYGGKVILGDRPVQVCNPAMPAGTILFPFLVCVLKITLRRTWGKMSLWHRAKFLYCIVFQSIFLPSTEELNKMVCCSNVSYHFISGNLKDMDDVDMLTLVIQEMSKEFPSLMETLLHERDLYMSSQLLKVAREHSSVVAVVGKGHVSGIKKNWQQPIQLKSLLELPAANQGVSKVKILASIGVLSGVLVASGIYLWGKK
ncbi:hypothetical protein PR202_gb01711 [Eleusine coracana subsp. coracana]|uniref:TraB domain-containing protein-like n=1 Tax=Eleusine coracana subsp. coracana TaxID=191504 RepID=A0AAV5DY42_ELECO|nr:hypothetical protein PR202_gb01711 [Eleusine coracana subsp. coracana]